MQMESHWCAIISHAGFSQDECLAQVLGFFKSATMVVQPFHELRLNIVKAIRAAPAYSPAAKSTLDIFTRHIRQYGQVFRRMAVGNTSRLVRTTMLLSRVHMAAIDSSPFLEAQISSCFTGDSCFRLRMTTRSSRPVSPGSASQCASRLIVF